MRLNAILAAAITSTAVFAVLGTVPVHAETSQTQPENSGQTEQKEQEKEEKFVEVKTGDYLAKIATENETTYPRLYDANTQIKDPNLIYPGDKLRVPTADEKLESRVPVQAPPAPVTRQTTTNRQPTYTPPTPAPSAVVSDGSVWDRLAVCESGGNWAINTGNGYYGGLQFSLSSWRGVGGQGYPHQASRDEQIARGKMLQARQGWGAWPACTLKLGIR